MRFTSNRSIGEIAYHAGYRRIFADVIVYIFAHQHTTYLIEAEAIYISKMQELKELIKLNNLCNFQLFASSIEGNIRHQKLCNCWVAKKLMSRTFPVKFRVFRK